MMNETNGKMAVIKTLAIVGFFVTIGLGVWLVIQGVRLMPGTFSSLASIAESIQNYRPTVAELTVATEKSIVNSGESFKLSWTDMKQDGTYRFTYTCTDGVTLDVRGENDLVTIPCTETLTLPGDVHGLFVSVSSGKQRFIDVPFTIAFVKASDETLIEQNAKITVVNATIPLKTEQEQTPVAEKPTETKPVETTKPVVATPTTPTQTPTTVKPKPTETKTVVSYIPVSDPNGLTDLKVSFLGAGTMDGATFTPSATFSRSERDGFKFEVKNIGTKTSGTWTFTTTLPNGVVYESEAQPALKPNERVVFTLGFNMDETDKAKTSSIKMTIFEKTDKNKTNDSFTWSVGVTN